jgi:hypothetical protein
MASGGVTMQGMKLAWGSERKGKVAQAILAAVLFSLLMAIWAYLWVPSAPVF